MAALSLLHTIETHYLQSAVEAAIKLKISKETYLYRKEKMQKRLDAILSIIKPYQQQIAKVIFDYLLLASLGELRYQNNTKSNERFSVFVPYKSLLGKKALNKNEIKREQFVALQCNKNGILYLPVCAVQLTTALEILHGTHILANAPSGLQGTGVSGDKWSKIAEYAARYFTETETIFLDGVLQLQHNNGTVFSKTSYNLVDCNHKQCWFEVQAKENLLEINEVEIVIQENFIYKTWWDVERKSYHILPIEKQKQKQQHTLYYVHHVFSFLKPLLQFYFELEDISFYEPPDFFSTLDVPPSILYTKEEKPIIIQTSYMWERLADQIYGDWDNLCNKAEKEGCSKSFTAYQKQCNQYNSTEKESLISYQNFKRNQVKKLQDVTDFLVVLPEHKQVLPINI